MDLKEIKQILKALEEYGANEFTLDTGEFKLAIKRGVQTVVAAAPVAAQPTVHYQPAQASAAQQAESPAAPADAAVVAATAAAAAASASNLVDVIAPIVGTFYASPSPDAPAFVKVGDRVKAGAVLCIIEAMKLMNEIEAEVAGVVREVAVANEDPVEYGQVLFRIEPD